MQKSGFGFAKIGFGFAKTPYGFASLGFAACADRSLDAEDRRWRQRASQPTLRPRRLAGKINDDGDELSDPSPRPETRTLDPVL